MIEFKLNRLRFLACLTISVFIYVALSYLLSGRLSDTSSIGRLAQNSFLQFMFSVVYFVLGVARLKDIGMVWCWSIVIFLPWLVGLDNMLLIDYYFNSSGGVNEFVTYIGVCMTIIALAFLLFLLFKPGQ